MTDSMLQLEEFIREHEAEPSQWYVGVAANPEKMLFKHHNVNRRHDSWIYRLAASHDDAREIHDSLVELGCDATQSLGELDGTLVYVYLKSQNTRP